MIPPGPRPRPAALLLFASLVGASLMAAPHAQTPQAPVEWMVGTFESTATDEAGIGPRFRLSTALLDTDRSSGTPAREGAALYLEHARLGRLHRPLAQRVVRVWPVSGGWRVAFEAIADARRFVSAQSSRRLLSALPGVSLTPLSACDLELRPTANGFEGRTRSDQCHGLDASAAPAQLTLTIHADGWTVREGAVGRDADGGVQRDYRRGSALDAARR